MDFTALHYQTTPLVIANVWDACSAIVAQQAGYQALGTSSAAIAATLGYDDGEVIPFEALLFIVKHIKSASSLPLSVDVEAGFGHSALEIASNLKSLAELGVVGINLEDSKVTDGVRSIEETESFATKLREIRHHLSAINISLFINIRTDTFLLGRENALKETLYRGHLYTQSGADGLFVPCMTDAADIDIVARELKLPLNVMCMPGLPDFTHLMALGVQRISMGNIIHDKLQQYLSHLMYLIQSRQSFSGVLHDESY
ncbi:isocitrate lyase/phosphoenolpyruvate mutase family protein [Citrobacter sp. JGM124]|uniref:isocitrate lyase/PEP mutase family protein n=1 Tax=Citrobacter sp. JGM124 TaxID=2799789 RepID=UPI001BADC2F1|nr:isocitrate lyase/phosphoenolpyruvate mutase family protein [Citrobacter sp. JGM124]MBS0847325.1 isocitrate lyase/phosphoenolpyruvate mutase family protein [Citrobacter sp. JGM124]